MSSRTLTGAKCVRIVGEDPFLVVAERVDDVGLLDVRLEDVTLGALEGDVIELGGDATGVPLVVRGVVDLGRPRPVGDGRGEAGISLDGMGWAEKSGFGYLLSGTGEQCVLGHILDTYP